jgi:hypothetical protein
MVLLQLGELVGNSAAGITYIVMLLARIALNVYIGRVQCHDRFWKWAFYLKAATAVISFFGDLAVLVLLQQAYQRDRQMRVCRDTAHRSGVWLQFAITGLTIVVATAVMIGITRSAFAK